MIVAPAMASRCPGILGTVRKQVLQVIALQFPSASIGGRSGLVVPVQNASPAHFENRDGDVRESSHRTAIAWQGSRFLLNPAKASRQQGPTNIVPTIVGITETTNKLRYSGNDEQSYVVCGRRRIAPCSAGAKPDSAGKPHRPLCQRSRIFPLTRGLR